MSVSVGFSKTASVVTVTYYRSEELSQEHVEQADILLVEVFHRLTFGYHLISVFVVNNVRGLVLAISGRSPEAGT